MEVGQFPEFVGVVVLDDSEAIYYDSNTEKADPRQDWMKKLIQDDPTHLNWYTDECRESQSFFNLTIKDLMQSFNQTGG